MLKAFVNPADIYHHLRSQKIACGVKDLDDVGQSISSSFLPFLLLRAPDAVFFQEKMLPDESFLPLFLPNPGDGAGIEAHPEEERASPDQDLPYVKKL